MATTVAVLQAVLNADTSDFDRGMDNSDSKMKAVGKAAGIAGLAIAGGLAYGLKKSVDAAQESEKAQARLEQAMGSAGLSFDKYGGSIEAAIQKTSKLAALDDEELSDSFAKLVRTTGDVAQATEGMGLAADLARARNISLEAATKTVEKALLGNENAFKRVGLEMEKGSSVAETMAAAQEKFGGAAKAYGETSAAAQERLGIALENLMERVGAKVLPALAAVTEAVVKMIEYIERNWPRIQKAIEPVIDDIKAFITGFVATVRTIWENWGDEILAVTQRIFGYIKASVENALQIIQGVFDIFAGLFTGDWNRMWDGIKAVFDGVWSQIKNIAGLALDAIVALLKEALPLMLAAATAIGNGIKNKIVDGVTGTATAVWNLILNIGELIAKGMDMIQGWGRDVGNWVKNAVVNALTGIGNAAWQIVLNVGERISDGAEVVRGWGSNIGEWIKNAVPAALAGIGGVAWNIINDIGGKIRDMGETIADWGAMIIRKIVGGVTGAAKDLWGAVEDIFNALPGFVKKILGISSPSKVFADIGKDLVAGLVQGLQDKAGDLRDAATDIAKDIAGDAWGKLSGAASGIVGAVGGVVSAVGGAVAGEHAANGPGGGGWVSGDVDGLVGAFYNRLVGMAAGHNQHLYIQSGFRSAAEQAALVASKGIWSPSNPTGAAPVGSSKHEYGLAADITPQSPSWPFHSKYGLHFPVPGEPWHIESYDKGGWLRPYSKTLAVNNTGQWEPVGPPGAGRGGDVYITVNGAVGAPRAIARQLRDALRDLERDAGRNPFGDIALS